MDSTLSGGRLKFLSVIDEFSRSCLSIKVDRTLTSVDVVAELERLITLHGAPNFIRCDNGPEFVAGATRQFLATADVTTLLIDPGSPWQNGYCESFNSELGPRGRALPVLEFSGRTLKPGDLHLHARSLRAQRKVATGV